MRCASPNELQSPFAPHEKEMLDMRKVEQDDFLVLDSGTGVKLLS